MKKLSTLLMLSVFAPAISFAQTSTSDCIVQPTCSELGYTQTATQCTGKTSVKCPFDETKVFCDSAMIGEIRIWAGPTAPLGWEFCDGSSLPTTTYAELFSIIGTTYNDSDTESGSFNLPDLNGRVPVGKGKSADTLDIPGIDKTFETDVYTYALGEKGGKNFVALSLKNLPDHQHIIPWGEGSGNITERPWGYHGYYNQAGNSSRVDWDNHWYKTSYVTDFPKTQSAPTSKNEEWKDLGNQDNMRNSPQVATVHENRMKFLGLNFIIFTGVYK